MKILYIIAIVLISYVFYCAVSNPPDTQPTQSTVQNKVLDNPSSKHSKDTDKEGEAVPITQKKQTEAIKQNSATPQTKQAPKSTIENKTEQQEIRNFAIKIADILKTESLGQDEIGAMIKSAKSNVGSPLDHAIDAQLTFERALREAKTITPPANGEKTINYLIEALEYILEGTKYSREAFESSPNDESERKLQQGLETYSKGLPYLDKSIEEFGKLKESAGL